MFNSGCLQFWFSFGQYIMDDNPIGSLWQPVAFVREKNAYAWEVYFINYITAYSLLLFITVYHPLNTFQHMGKMFMNSLLFMVWEFHFSVFSEMILWAKETCSFFYINNTTLFILN